jgi:hypothetical protein
MFFADICCVPALIQAYEKAKILHRDISAGNIVIWMNDEGKFEGLLVDWERSKPVFAVKQQSPHRMVRWAPQAKFNWV